MKRTIKTIILKDGKQICYPSDPECKLLWDQVDKVVIEESYTMEEFNKKYVLIRSFDDELQ